MKNIILVFSLSLMSSWAFGQDQLKTYYENDFDFTTTLPITIDTSLKGNLWQIGVVNKRVIDTAYSGYKAIITDLKNEYAKNNVSVFSVAMNQPVVGGNNSLSFYHIYETDAKMDGGMIETSYDSGKTWIDIMIDTMFGKMLSSNNMYGNNDSVDALHSPGFSGKLKTWKQVTLYWRWQQSISKKVLFRFVFKSDSIDNQKDGWAIDDIALWSYLLIGSINNGILQTSQSQPYPNPCSNNLNFNFENGFSGEVKIFNAEGKIVRCVNSQNNNLMQLPETKDKVSGNSKLYKVVKHL
ncbi:MAG: hypothetical protein NTX03_09620 [Bacteroidetes bacterium]|nr:hypothetical protein [Bacteroidota bacterium]